MTWIIWTIRNWFCKHEFEREEREVKYHDGDPENIVAIKIMVSATCTKCGWHRRYRKFH